LWGVFGFLSKLASKDLGPWQMQVLFTIGAAPLSVVALVRVRARTTRDKVGWAIGAFTGILAALSNLALFYAIRSGDVAIVAPLTALSPLVTFLLSTLILKERPTRLQNLGAACAITAIVLLST
jgi:drug/metabolite transporter (DMT)-like permease